MIKIGLF